MRLLQRTLGGTARALGPFVSVAVLVCGSVVGCGGDGGSSASPGAGAATGTGGGAGASSTGGAANGGGASSGGASSGGASSGGGGQMSCVTERVALAQSQTTSECGFDVPEGADTSVLNVAIASGGQDQIVCRRFSSQGCSPQGWWINGGSILLCDETCGSFNDFPDRQLVALVGCDSDTCL